LNGRKERKAATDGVNLATTSASPPTAKADLYHQDLAACTWRKSQYSVGEGQCVEIAEISGGVAVRDSKNPHLAPLCFTVQEWEVFRLSLITGDL
jgi:hypothetical protein